MASPSCPWTALWSLPWLDAGPLVISVPLVLALQHITAPGRHEGCDFMGSCSKGQDIFKVLLSRCSVSEFVAACSYHIPLLPGRALISTHYLPGASACSSLVVSFRAQLLLILLLATRYLLPFHRCSLGICLYLMLHLIPCFFFPWKSPSLDCYFYLVLEAYPRMVLLSYWTHLDRMTGLPVN